MRSTLRSAALAAAALMLAAAVAAQTTPNPAVPGGTVSVTGTVTLPSACSACTVYLRLNDANGNDADDLAALTQTFKANTATPLTVSFTVPPAAVVGTYALYYNVFSSGSSPASVGAGQLGTVVVAAVGGTPAAATGTISVAWKAPTTATNGNPITDALGYNVYRGSSASSLGKVNAAPVTATTYVDSGVPAGTWFYAVTAVDLVTGAESAQGISQPPSVTIAVAPPAVPSAPTGATLTCTLPAGSPLQCVLTNP